MANLSRHDLSPAPVTCDVVVVVRMLALLAFLLASPDLFAQQLEPRAYSPNPVGSHFVVVGLGESSGGVALDPSVPIENVQGTTDAAIAGYGQTFALFGRVAGLAVVLPYANAEYTGDVLETSRRVTRNGFGDLNLRFALGLLGSPALSLTEFMHRKPAPALGVSLLVVAPTGQYFPDRLINLGANRWSFKPEIGFTWPRGAWDFELTAGIWYYTDNKDFFGGHVREQELLTTTQAHVSYTFRPRLWVAASATYYTGGRTTVDSVRKADWQSNERYGITFSLPLLQTQSIKFSWSKGATTRIGSDFTTYSLGWQLGWFK